MLVASVLWADRNVVLAPDFQKRCRRFYDAHVETLDLRSPASVTVINGWVGKSTRGKITRLVSREDLTAATLVLTNALYFHGKWRTPFDKASTRTAPFSLAGGGTKTVPMMRQKTMLPYIGTPELQAACLPYGSGRMGLYVVLPHEDRSVDDLIASMDGEAWQRLTAGVSDTHLTLFVPRFKAKYSARLRGALSALGMAAAFGGGADFTPMGLVGSFIGDVIHDAMVEVDEEGTVAAAATGVVMTRGRAPEPIVMRVDRPFLIAIQDNLSGAILFQGVVRDPE